MKLYHYRLCLPVKKYPLGTYALTYTNHAIEASRTDKHGSIRLPTHLDTTKAKKIEVELDEKDNLVKILYQIPLDEERNLSLAVLMKPSEEWKVKTVWSQPKWDTHETLDWTRYVR